MYCSLDEFIARFDLDELVQLTDPNGTGSIGRQVAEAAIVDASSLIDGYLGGRYALPLTTVPTVLIRLCADIARYNLYDNAVTDVVEKNYKHAVDFLMNVSTGKVRLGLSGTNEKAESDAVISIESGVKVFSRDNAKGFI
jgi:phage gp36-like protein